MCDNPTRACHYYNLYSFDTLASGGVGFGALGTPVVIRWPLSFPVVRSLVERSGMVLNFVYLNFLYLNVSGPGPAVCLNVTRPFAKRAKYGGLVRVLIGRPLTCPLCPWGMGSVIAAGSVCQVIN